MCILRWCGVYVYNKKVDLWFLFRARHCKRSGGKNKPHGLPLLHHFYLSLSLFFLLTCLYSPLSPFLVYPSFHSVTMTCTSTPTLESILHNRSTDHYREFAAFVHETFCTENLSFWLAIQHYLDLCHRLGYGTLESLDDAIVLSKNNALFRFTVHERGIIDNKAFAEIQGACHAILYNHIRPNSPQEINIPCEMRQEILQLVQEQGNYHPAVFAAATESVVELMRANSFIPWTQRNQRTSFSSVRSNDDQALSVFRKMKRSLFGGSSTSTLVRPYLSAPSTPRSSGDSLRWSPWRKLQPR